jgi:hypothetical protein
MPKKRGSYNYSYAEQIHLLTVIGRILPVEQRGWDAVAADYNADATSLKRVRDIVSLKRKFNSISRAYERASESNRTTLQTLAHEVKRRVDERVCRQRTRGRLAPQSSSSIVCREVEQSGAHVDGEFTSAARQRGSEPVDAAASSGSTGAAGGPDVAAALLNRSSVKSTEDHSDATSDEGASRHRDAFASVTSCNCGRELRSLERQLDRLQEVVIRELQTVSKVERSERKRERALDMRSARRFQRQLQECVLTLSM